MATGSNNNNNNKIGQVLAQQPQIFPSTLDSTPLLMHLLSQ
jgi:hypothetical protein